MAFTSLTADLNAVFGTNQTIFNDELSADVTVREKPSFKATPTKKRVESGGIATDNIFIEPVDLDLEIIFTDDILAGVVGNTAAEKAGTFEGYWRGGRRNKVQTSFKLYENMAIISFDVDRDKNTAGAAFIRVSMTEVRVISTSLLSNASTDAADTVAGSTDQGFKATTPASEADESFLFGFVEDFPSFNN